VELGLLDQWELDQRADPCRATASILATIYNVEDAAATPRRRAV
jgi:hypothetical protein